MYRPLEQASRSVGPMDIHYSAGGVVIGPGNKIIVVSQNGNSWSLPKGHLEEGEDEEDAATREIFEESGIQDVKIIQKIGEYERARIGIDGIGEIILPDYYKFLNENTQVWVSPINGFGIGYGEINEDLTKILSDPYKKLKAELFFL